MRIERWARFCVFKVINVTQLIWIWWETLKEADNSFWCFCVKFFMQLTPVEYGNSFAFYLHFAWFCAHPLSNKKVLLLDRKRRTARGVATTLWSCLARRYPYLVLRGTTVQPGGTLILSEGPGQDQGVPTCEKTYKLKFSTFLENIQFFLSLFGWIKTQ